MVPGFALLFATLFVQQAGKSRRLMSVLTLLCPLLTIIITVVFVWRPDAIGRNQQSLIKAWRLDNPDPGSALLYFNTRREFSAEFYSGGRAHTSVDPEQARVLLHNASRDYIAVNSSKFNQLPADVIAAFSEIGRYHNNGQTMILLREHEVAGH